MKRSQIESQIKQIQLRIRREIESAPIQAFLVGIVIGIVAILLRGLLIPLAFLAAVALAVCWFMAESDSPSKFSFDERDLNPPPPPSAAGGTEPRTPEGQEPS